MEQDKKGGGMFYAVGVGPGDPQMMTYKAVRTIQACDVLALPVSDDRLKEPAFEERQGALFRAWGKDCVAYRIASGMIPDLAKKPVLYLPMPMIKEKERLQKAHDAGADALAGYLDAGKDVAFITLGDPSVYSTCLYIKKRLDRTGHRTGIIPGIASFLACAARLGIGLSENRQMLHVIPGSYGVEEALALPGTKILMKAGRSIGNIRAALLDTDADVYMVENCGMADERVYYGAREIPEDAGYYTLLIIKERKKQDNT